MAVSEKTSLRREKWKKEILEIIRQEGETGRTAVKRISGLSMDSTLGLMDELLAEGLIETVGKEEQTGAGRRATLLRIRPDGCYFIGVRFSAGGLSAVCTDFTHRVVDEREEDFLTPPDTKTMLDAVCRAIGSLVEGLGKRRERLRGIGVGAPGILDPVSGVISRYVHIADWKNVPLKALLEERFQVPVRVEHGVKSTARLMQEESPTGGDMLLVQMGRGINLCAVANDRVVRGVSGLAGEIGHVHVEGGKLLCECGRRGCLETEVSSAILLERVKKGLQEKPDSYPILRGMTGDGNLHLRTVCEAADLGDPDARALVTRAAGALGKALSSAILLMNPGRVEVNGRLCCSAEFRKTLTDTLEEICLTEILQKTVFHFSDNSRRTDAVGAARLPFRQFFAPAGGEDPFGF